VVGFERGVGEREGGRQVRAWARGIVFCRLTCVDNILVCSDFVEAFGSIFLAPWDFCA
jgi:hypothetical protein